MKDPCKYLGGHSLLTDELNTGTQPYTCRITKFGVFDNSRDGGMIVTNILVNCDTGVPFPIALGNYAR